MLKILRQTLSVWKKNINSNIIVMILICMSCYTGSYAFNRISTIYEYYNSFKDTRISRSLLFVGRDMTQIESDDREIAFYNAVDTKYMKSMVSLAEDSGIVEGASQFLNYGAYIKEQKKYASAIIYDKITASYIKDFVKLQGSWIFEKEKTDADCYPIVVYNGDYKIGEIIEVELTMGANCQPLYEDLIPDKTAKVKAQIVGIARSFDPFLPYLGLYKSNAPAHNDVGGIFNVFDGMLSDRTVFFFPYDELFQDYAYTNDTALFYFTDEASDEEISAFYEEALNCGYCAIGSEIIDYTKRTADKVLRNDFFEYLSIFGLMLTSVICISFLNLKKLKKDFCIYYLNGCSFFRSTVMYFIYFLTLYTIPLIFSALINVILKYVTENNFYYSDFKFVLISCLLGLIISLVAAIIPFTLIKRKTPIQNIKES